jgi:hypothetical protein
MTMAMRSDSGVCGMVAVVMMVEVGKSGKRGGGGTVLVCPEYDAWCNGETPLEESMLGSPPASCTKNFRVSSCPLRAASCMAVRPLPSL